MPIRLAKPEDITAAMEVGKKILDRSVINAEVYDLQARKVMLRACNDKSMRLWVAEHKGSVVGFLMVVKETHWFSKNKYASDICFCLDDRHGNYASGMIRRFVKWAEADPLVKDITLGISSGLDKDERTGHMYQNLGFTKVGGVYAILETGEE